MHRSSTTVPGSAQCDLQCRAARVPVSERAAPQLCATWHSYHRTLNRPPHSTNERPRSPSAAQILPPGKHAHTGAAATALSSGCCTPHCSARCYD